QMQDTFGAIMIALVNGVPKVLTVKQMLYYYIEHQVDVIVRRTKYDLNKAEARAHILEGLLHALDIIDLVIQTIRSSRTTQEARDRLVNELEFTEKQAQAILDMRLQRLTGLEREKLQQEYEELEKLIAYYRQVLSDHGMVLGIIKDELGEIRRRFADERRTEIRQMEYEVALADLIQEEDMVVTLTHRGYIKRLSLSSYRAQRRGGKGVTAAATREEDFVEQLYVMSTHDRVMFFTNKGRAFDLNCYEIPEAGRTARGMAIVNLLRLESEERVTSMLRIDMDRLEGYYIVMATRDGLIKRTALSEFANMRKSGLRAVNLREDDELISVQQTDGRSDLLIGTVNGMSIRFPEEEVRAVGRTAAGVRSITLRGDDKVVDMSVIDDSVRESGAQVLAVTENGYGKRTSIDAYRCQSRGGVGIRAMALSDKTGKLVNLMLIDEDMDLMVITDDGIIIRMPVDSISSQGRSTQGVRIMRVASDSRVVCVARSEREEEETDVTGDEIPETENEDGNIPDEEI
ncbi:MAG: DNA gyrase subunit A, partial [Clostridia bacterium]|nr:DNA gyrase subunit A [Clostridia bacterium]